MSTVSSRQISVPRVMQVEPGARHGLADALGEAFDARCVAIVTGAEISLRIARSLAHNLESQGVQVRVHAGVAGTLAAAADLVHAFDHEPVTLIVAVGGGRPIDVAKLAAARLGVAVVVVPTILASDGICSPVVTLLGADGRRRSVGAAMPAGVIIDLDVVGRAPERYLRAGIGDLVSNITAVADWRYAAQIADEPYDELAATVALVSAQSALDVAWPPTVDDLSAIARGLVMSGVAMEVAGSSRPCSGGEHLVSHALDQIRGPEAALHGEHVALGVYLVAALQDNPEQARLRALFERIGLPPFLDLWGVDQRLICDALDLAPSTRPARATALDEGAASFGGFARLVDEVFARGSAS